MAQTSTASAVWEGELKSGTGRLSTGSGALDGAAYDFPKRFEGAAGLNPEELIGAAIAGCFSMALSGQLANGGLTPGRIETKATVTMEPVDGKPTVNKVHLDVTVTASGGDEAAFRQAAENAKSGCPISRLLKAEITMDARLA